MDRQKQVEGREKGVEDGGGGVIKEDILLLHAPDATEWKE